MREETTQKKEEKVDRTCVCVGLGKRKKKREKGERGMYEKMNTSEKDIEKEDVEKEKEGRKMWLYILK